MNGAQPARLSALLAMLLSCALGTGAAPVRGQQAATGNGTQALSIPLADPVTRRTIQLAAVLYLPAEPGPFPLVVISHGAPANHAEAVTYRARFRAQSRWFVERGFAVVVPTRRGYGDSGGVFSEDSGPCRSPDYEASGTATALDILATVRFMQQQPSIDKNQVVLVGVSGGGWGSLAAAAQQPPGLAAVVNVAGGRGSDGKGHTCAPDRLVSAAARFGAKVNVPTLWIWAQNDGWFPPELGRAMFSAFNASHAGRDTFVECAPFESEGHRLFSDGSGVAVWSVPVSAFLDRVKSLSHT